MISRMKGESFSMRWIMPLPEWQRWEYRRRENSKSISNISLRKTGRDRRPRRLWNSRSRKWKLLWGEPNTPVPVKCLRAHQGPWKEIPAAAAMPLWYGKTPAILCWDSWRTRGARDPGWKRQAIQGVCRWKWHSPGSRKVLSGSWFYSLRLSFVL